jgi:hypothetical protein
MPQIQSFFPYYGTTPPQRTAEGTNAKTTSTKDDNKNVPDNIRTLRQFSANTHTITMADEFSGPLSRDWAARSGILGILFRKDGEIQKVDVATDAIHTMKQLSFIAKPVDLNEFYTKSYRDNSYLEMRHAQVYLDMLAENGIITATGDKIPLPDVTNDIRPEKVLTALKINLETRIYNVKPDEELEKYLVENLRPAPLEDTTSLVVMNIKNAYELHLGMNKTLLTKGAAHLLRTVYPPIPTVAVVTI